MSAEARLIEKSLQLGLQEGTVILVADGFTLSSTLSPLTPAAISRQRESYPRDILNQNLPQVHMAHMVHMMHMVHMIYMVHMVHMVYMVHMFLSGSRGSAIRKTDLV